MKPIIMVAIAALAIIPVVAVAELGWMKDVTWVDVQADKLTYQPGDTIHLTGKITMPNTVPTEAKLSIHTLDGSSVYSQTVQLQNGGLDVTTQPINVSHGTYYVEIAEGETVERINVQF